MNPNSEKHKQQLPTAREIRRACSRELYRTVKKLNRWIPPEKVEEGEKLYFRKVAMNLVWVHENGSNRRVLADWWEENVCPELAELWDVDKDSLAKAFRLSFGG